MTSRFGVTRRHFLKAGSMGLAGLAGGLAAMMAHGLVDHSFFLIDLAYVFYLILGLALWLQRAEQEAYT